MADADDVLSIPERVFQELCDSDEDIRRQFLQRYEAQSRQFAHAFSEAFKGFSRLTEACNHNVQTALVSSFVHGVLDDLLTSMKLFLTGKLGASGNLLRQASEGICMAVMAAHRGALMIAKQERVYWRLVADNDGMVQGHLAIRQFLENSRRLGFNPEAGEQLKVVLKAHDMHSHAGLIPMVLRMDLRSGGKSWFGGHFDADKAPAYDREIEQRIQLCRWVCQAIPVLSDHVRQIVATELAHPSGGPPESASPA